MINPVKHYLEKAWSFYINHHCEVLAVIVILAILLCASCSVLAPVAGAGGGAALGSLAGPGGAALGEPQEPPQVRCSTRQSK